MLENNTKPAAPRLGQTPVAELQEYSRQIAAVSEDARHLVSGLSEAQFNWHAEPGQWSIAECLNHLAVTNCELIKKIEGALGHARSKGLFGKGPFRHGFLGNLIIRSMEPPPKRKFKAPQIFQPVPDKSLAEVTRDFFAAQDEVLRLIYEADGVDLGRVKLASPVTRLIRYSLGQAFLLIATHDRRHLWQARQVKENPLFPET